MNMAKIRDLVLKVKHTSVSSYEIGFVVGLSANYDFQMHANNQPGVFGKKTAVSATQSAAV